VQLIVKYKHVKLELLERSSQEVFWVVTPCGVSDVFAAFLSREK
jgi:hypothetical protein